jgi:hypothetical protein
MGLCRQDLRTQLSQERDTLRHLRLQKDIEIREFQNKQEKIVGVSVVGVLQLSNR